MASNTQETLLLGPGTCEDDRDTCRVRIPLRAMVSRKLSLGDAVLVSVTPMPSATMPKPVELTRFLCIAWPAAAQFATSTHLQLDDMVQVPPSDDTIKCDIRAYQHCVILIVLSGTGLPRAKGCGNVLDGLYTASVQRFPQNIVRAESVCFALHSSVTKVPPLDALKVFVWYGPTFIHSLGKIATSSVVPRLCSPIPKYSIEICGHCYNTRKPLRCCDCSNFSYCFHDNTCNCGCRLHLLPTLRK